MIRLINSDFRNILAEILATEGKSKDIIIVSDPPFNIGYRYNKYKDNKTETEYFALMKAAFGKGKCVIIHYPETLYKISAAIGKIPNKVVSWVYNSNTPRQHRDIAFFDIKPNFNQVRQPYKNIKDKRIIQRIANGQKGGKLYDWWNVNQVKNVSKQKTEHPCQMPLEVMKNIIGILPKGILVVDPFMGSGTTGVACAECGVDFLGIEIDKLYYDIANLRLKNV